MLTRASPQIIAYLCIGMKKNRIIGIIVVSSLALVGLIVTQLFWVNNALRLAEKQHNHRVNMALDEVLDEMVYHQDTLLGKEDPSKRYDPARVTLFQVIDTVLLGQLLEKYIDYHMLEKPYEYAIVKTSNDSLIFSSTPDIEAIGSRPHKACLSCLWKKDYFHLEVFFPDQREAVLTGMSFWLFFSALFLLTLVLILSYIILTVIRQKKISEMKNDFINNMTHEFKTPISTISLASEVLLGADGNTSDHRIRQYARVIHDENIRMRSQVEQLLLVAQLDKGEFRLKKQELNIHELIRESVHHLCLEHCEKNTDVRYEFKSQQPVVMADKLHMRNIINNLVDNAVKYSKEEPRINIRTSDNNQGIYIEVEDNGIGIHAEARKHIFDKFYRIPTGDVHDVKGFGLGLYYVRNMVEAHQGSISVQSEPGKGSNFMIYLPRKQEVQTEPQTL